MLSAYTRLNEAWIYGHPLFEIGVINVLLIAIRALLHILAPTIIFELVLLISPELFIEKSSKLCPSNILNQPLWRGLMATLSTLFTQKNTNNMLAS